MHVCSSWAIWPNIWRNCCIRPRKAADLSGVSARLSQGRRSGTGKTYIAARLVHEAVKNGYRAYMVTLEDLLTCLKTRDVSRHAMKTYKRITKAQLLAIDNATLFPLKREDVMLLFKLVNEFQEKTSLIVTANYSLTE